MLPAYATCLCYLPTLPAYATCLCYPILPAYATCLRAAYTMPGSDAAYGATHRYRDVLICVIHTGHRGCGCQPLCACWGGGQGGCAADHRGGAVPRRPAPRPQAQGQTRTRLRDQRSLRLRLAPPSSVRSLAS
eukprot:2000479-Rhodomonas_salina.1